jgi:hypothetical protein
MGLVGIRAFVDQDDLAGAAPADARMLETARSAPIGLAIFSREFFGKGWPMRELQILLEQGSLLPILSNRPPAFTHEDLVMAAKMCEHVSAAERNAFAERVARITHIGPKEPWEQPLQEEVCWNVVRLFTENVCPRLSDAVFTARTFDRIRKAAELIVAGPPIFCHLNADRIERAKKWAHFLGDLEERLAARGTSKFD